jgi:hypothetical protein
MKGWSEMRERGWLDRVNWVLGGRPGSHRMKSRGDGDGEKSGWESEQHAYNCEHCCCLCEGTRLRWT